MDMEPSTTETSTETNRAIESRPFWHNPVAVALISVVMFAALYFLRRYDDNRLTGWGMVFQHVDYLRTLLAVAAASFVGAWLSRFDTPGPRGLFLISFSLSITFWPIPEVIVDASRYMAQAEHLEKYGVGYFISEWGRGIEAWTDMPLMSFIYGLCFKAFGQSREAVQIVNSMMYALSVAMTASFAQRWFRPGLTDEDAREIGALAGVFMMAMPFLMSQVPLMMADVGSMFFLLLAMWLFERALDRGGAFWIAAAGCALFAALVAKYSLWLMLSVLVWMAVVSMTRTPAPSLRRTVGVGVVFVALASWWFISYTDVIARQVELLVTYQKPGLARWGEGWLSTFFFQTHPFVTLLAIWSGYAAYKKADFRFIAVAWLVAFIFLFNIKRSRYTIPVMPPLAMMAAYGACTLLPLARTRRVVAYVAALASVALVLFAYSPVLRINELVNLKLAGEYLNAQGVTSARVFTLPQRSIINPAISVPILDLYYNGDIEYDFTLRSTAPPEVLEESTYRFTWTYRNPEYYGRAADAGEKVGRVVVISPEPPERVRPLPEGHELEKIFDINKGLYRFKPYVYIYKNLH